MLVTVLHQRRVDRAELERLARAATITQSGLVHVLMGPQAEKACAALRELLEQSAEQLQESAEAETGT